MHTKLFVSAAAVVIATAGAGAQGPTNLAGRPAGTLVNIPPKVWQEVECDEVAVQDYPFLKVMIVFGADNDGSRATADITGYQTIQRPVRAGERPRRPERRPIYRPAAPWLALGQRDFVKEMVRHTNRVLANSDAPFRLDEDDIAYDRIDNTALNDAVDGGLVKSELQKKIDTDPRYKSRMVMHMPWGIENTKPRGGGSSDVDSPYVGLPSRLDGDTKWRGKPVWGWNMMPHEFGHFMGLQHTFVEAFLNAYAAMAAGARGASVAIDAKGNEFMAFTKPASHPQAYHPQPSSPELIKDREELTAWIKKYLSGSLDADAGSYSRPEGNSPLPKWTVDGVSDTPVDFGFGVGPVDAAQDPCTPLSIGVGNHTFTNEVNRTNIMSYTLCRVDSLRYSPGQVKVMTAMLDRPEKKRFVQRRSGTIRKCTPAPSAVGGGL